MHRLKTISVFILLASFCFVNPIKAQLDYNDVAPIFYQHCTSCHHANQVSQFSLLTYEQTKAYEQYIRTDLLIEHMPPWFPDTAYTRSSYPAPRFLHENIISLEDKNKILQWFLDGGLEGDPKQAIAPPVYEKPTYRLNGSASLTLKIPDFKSNAIITLGAADNCFSLPTGLTSDKWLQAFEVVPGNYKIVHNVTVTLDSSGVLPTDTSGYCTNGRDEIFLGSWGPNGEPTVFPNHSSFKAGIKIPAGSNIILRVNYAIGSQGMLDSTKIRLFFYPDNEVGIREIHSDAFLQYWGKQGLGGNDILANDAKTYTVTPSSDQTFPHDLPPSTDMSLFAINPLSRDICTVLEDYAFMGTDTIPLIRFRLWDYEWEGAYIFTSLKKIPAGYTLKTDRFFENTFNNIHQPNSPIRDVNFGPSSSEDIIFDSFQWLEYQVGDELLDIKALIKGDTLLIPIVGIEDLNFEEETLCFIYPNPASENVTLSLSKKSEYTGSLYNITGASIKSFGVFQEKTTIDVSDIPPGIYFVELIDNNTKAKIAKKIVITK